MLCFYKIKDVEEFCFCFRYRQLEGVLLTTLRKKCQIDYNIISFFEPLGVLMSRHNHEIDSSRRDGPRRLAQHKENIFIKASKKKPAKILASSKGQVWDNVTM